MAAQINSKKVKFFRWHDSGDVQNLDHLRRIYAVCKLTPEVQHWMPTREAWTKDYIVEAPDNLVVRFSIPMVDQAATDSWPHTSTVSTKKIDVTCPAPLQGNQCKDCGLAGTNQFQMFATVSIKKNSRGNKDSVISKPEARTAPTRALGPGLLYGSFRTINGSSAMIQASSSKPQAPSITHQSLESFKRQATSLKLQAPSDKHPIPSSKPQASSHKQQAP